MSNLNPGNFYKVIDRYGTEIVQEGAPDFIPAPINYTPAASGNTTNLNEFVVDPQGDIYFIDADGEAFKVNTTQTVTTITGTKTGSKIATYTNESGVAVDINETITSLQTFSITGNVITLEYVAEDGLTTTKTVTVPSDVVTTITNAVTGHKIADYTNESGTVVSINETVTSIGTITYDSITGVLTIPYTDENSTVNSKTVTIPTALNVLTTVQPTPASIGNTTNLNSVFKDASGITWIVDQNGDAVQAGSPETVSYGTAAPTIAAVAGDEYYITSDGTSAGVISKRYIYDGTNWVLTNTAFKNLNEWHVDPNGSDTTGDGSQEKPYATITKALTMAGQGDQVIVHAGVYTENITVSTPNVSIVGAQSDYSQLTQIDGSITVTATGTSVKIADLRATSVSHTGSAPLYLENVTLTSTLTSSSTGYLEIRNSTIQDGTITKSAGSMTIEQSKIDNVSITGTNTAGIIRNSYQDGGSTVTYGAGTIYGIYNLQGGDLSVNAAAIPIETAALAQGLSAELAKEAETADFMKLGMIRPDTEASPTKVVTWDELTGRLEVTDLSIISGDQYKTTSTTCQNIVSTGNITLTVEPGLAYTPLQDIIVYADASNHMHGQIVSYNTATGELVMHVHQKSGSGNFCNWTVNLDAIKLSEVSVYFGTQDPDTAGQAGIEGDLYYVTSNGTGTGTVTETWVYDATYGWVQIPMSSPELVQFGTTAPTSTTGYTAGDEFFVTSNGTSTGTITAQYIFNGTTWTLRPTPVASLTTTSISPKVYQSGSFVNAQANLEANVADLLQLSDGSRIHTGEVTWTGHGLTVGAWYYLSQTTPGAYTTTRPTSGLVQQLFFVEDANTIHVDIEEAWNASGTSSTTFANTVYVNATSPTSATIFDTANPPVTNNNALKADVSNIYIGTDGSMWTYNSSTSTYTTYTVSKTVFKGRYSAGVVVNPATSGYVVSLNQIQINTTPTAWNNTTGTFTAPASGYYMVAASLSGGTNLVTGSYIELWIEVNGVIQNGFLEQASAAGNTVHLVASGAVPVYMAAGNTLRFRFNSNLAIFTTHVNSTYFSITQL
jgi:hypothetical protein